MVPGRSRSLPRTTTSVPCWSAPRTSTPPPTAAPTATSTGRTEPAPAAEAAPADRSPGTVLSADAAGVRVATGEGVLRLLELQRPGGRMLPAAAFLAGFRIEPGATFASEPMPDLVGKEPFRAPRKD